MSVVPPRIVVALLATLLATGCGPSDDAAGARRSDAASSATTPVSCSNPEGGACLNELEPGRTYTTTRFSPAISYTAAESGWSNLEDLSGNFLLVAPGNDLAGVNAGTSDFIGVYSSITPSRFADLSTCATAPITTVPATPRGFVGWMRRQPVLAVSTPKPVALSGLTGLVTDVRVAPGQRPPTCTDNGSPVTVALLFSGLPPSSLDHGVITGMTMRLYLLQRGVQLMVVEVDDIDAAPGDLDSLSAQVQRLRFSG